MIHDRPCFPHLRAWDTRDETAALRGGVFPADSATRSSQSGRPITVPSDALPARLASLQ
jgi:hypothetical protein